MRALALLFPFVCVCCAQAPIKPVPVDIPILEPEPDAPAMSLPHAKHKAARDPADVDAAIDRLISRLRELRDGGHGPHAPANGQ